MKFTEETIFRYLDGDLTLKENKEFATELEKNKSFSNLYARIKLLETSLKEEKLATPSAQFAENVMASVYSDGKQEGRFFNGTRVLSLCLIVLIVVGSTYYFGNHFYPSFSGVMVDQISLNNFTINLQPAQQLLDSSVLFKIVLYVNGLISLLLLDRAILKPYFMRRRQHYSM